MGLYKGLLILLLSSGLAYAQPEAGFFDKIDSISGDHCKDQTLAFLDNYFGDDFKIIKITKASGGSKNMKTKQYWIKNNLCRGYMVMETVPKPSCSTAHYGYVPLYIDRLWGHGECRRTILKRDVFPRRDDLGDLYN